MKEIHKAFMLGAERLARENCKYTTLHKEHGLEQSDWQLLTQYEAWSPDQARSIRSILASALEVSMTIAGMPAVPLPGQYVAGLIAKLVSPQNRMIACMKAPDTFDADAASGVMGTHEIKDMPWQQLMALTLLYSANFEEEPQQKLPREVGKVMKKENAK